MKLSGPFRADRGVRHTAALELRLRPMNDISWCSLADEAAATF